MNARFLPLLLAGLTTAALAGCDPSPAPPAADAHAGHDHDAASTAADAMGVSGADAHAGHDHGEGGSDEAHAGHDHGEGGSDADHAAHAGHDHGEGGAAGGHHSDHGTSSNASNPTTTPAETSR